MTHERGFLADIVASPDAPRLILADWHEENGDPGRAAFARAQVGLARAHAWEEGYTGRDLRCRDLARCHPEWLDWLGADVVRQTVFFGRDPFPFRRGFPYRVTMLEELTIDDTGNRLTPGSTRDLAEVLPGSAIISFGLGEWPMDQAGARALAEAIGRQNLESLTLSNTRLEAPLPEAVLGGRG